MLLRAEHHTPALGRGEGQVGQPELGQTVAGPGVVAGGGDRVLKAEDQCGGRAELVGQVRQEALAVLGCQDVEAAAQGGQDSDELGVGHGGDLLHQGPGGGGGLQAAARRDQQSRQSAAQVVTGLGGGGAQPGDEAPGEVVLAGGVEQEP